MININAVEMEKLVDGDLLIPDELDGAILFRGMSLVRAVLNLTQHGHVVDQDTYWSSRDRVAKLYAGSVSNGSPAAIQDCGYDMDELAQNGIRLSLINPPGLVVAVGPERIDKFSPLEANVATAIEPIELTDLIVPSQTLIERFVIINK